MVPVPLPTLGAWHPWRVGTFDPPLALSDQNSRRPSTTRISTFLLRPALGGCVAFWHPLLPLDWEDDELSELSLDSLVLPLEESVSLDLRLLPFLFLWLAFFAFLRSLRSFFFSFLCFFLHSSFK